MQITCNETQTLKNASGTRSDFVYNYQLKNGCIKQTFILEVDHLTYPVICLQLFYGINLNVGLMMKIYYAPNVGMVLELFKGDDMSEYMMWEELISTTFSNNVKNKDFKLP